MCVAGSLLQDHPEFKLFRVLLLKLREQTTRRQRAASNELAKEPVRILCVCARPVYHSVGGARCQSLALSKLLSLRIRPLRLAKLGQIRATGFILETV